MVIAAQAGYGIFLLHPFVGVGSLLGPRLAEMAVPRACLAPSIVAESIFLLLSRSAESRKKEAIIYYEDNYHYLSLALSLSLSISLHISICHKLFSNFPEVYRI